MWLSGTTSRSCRAVLLAWLLATSAGSAEARVLLGREEALAEAFPGAELVRVAAFLTDEQMDLVEERAGSRPDSRVVIYYRAVEEGRHLGTAYFDVHLVRTLAEALMILVDPEGRVVRVEILAFNEPPEYMAPSRWLSQFEGKELDERLRVKRDIQGITGATLTARAVTAAVRRVLAIHLALAEVPDTPALERRQRALAGEGSRTPADEERGK